MACNSEIDWIYVAKTVRHVTYFSLFEQLEGTQGFRLREHGVVSERFHSE